LFSLLLLFAKLQESLLLGWAMTIIPPSSLQVNVRAGVDGDCCMGRCRPNYLSCIPKNMCW
jgi:hypothetical protein